MKDITYYIYHIPGKKIGVTTNLKSRVEDQQGYGPGEYEILARRHDISEAAKYEAIYQRIYGYPVDIVPYDKLNCNKNKLNMKINITEQTTTFPCPANKLKGQLMDNMGMKWMTEHGRFTITPATVRWIMKNIKTSMFNEQRSYVYNKAFARFYDNNNAFDLLGGNLEDVHMRDQYNGKTLTGGLSPERVPECCDEDNPCVCKSEPQFSKRPKHEFTRHTGLNDFDLIRMWANQRGIYEHGDTKTQSLKLVEEVGEICRAILKEDHDEVVDGIGDAVVVLTNLAELQGVSIEKCINVAYNVISQRSGKMVNGTFKKD
jgi:NTP pyrophosphatase (non-canonical NTP hydrolase)